MLVCFLAMLLEPLLETFPTAFLQTIEDDGSKDDDPGGFMQKQVLR